jgi:Tfp pilus assembly protein PilW
MMARWCFRRRPGRGEEGFTLIELLVASLAGLVVVGALATMMTSVLRAQPESQDRAAQLQDARVMLERMVRDLRQGAPVTGATANATQVTVDTYTRAGCNGGGTTTTAVLCRVTYACAQSGATASCTRRAGTGTAVTMLTGLRTDQVFAYGTTTSPTCNATSDSAPSLICITLAYPGPKGAESVTVEDSAYLRNPAA